MLASAPDLAALVEREERLTAAAEFGDRTDGVHTVPHPSNTPNRRCTGTCRSSVVATASVTIRSASA